MALTSNERLQEKFSLALEDRSRGYQDLVSNANVVLAVIKGRGGWKTFSGPTIRERLLFAESGTYTRYSGYQFLNPKPAELINDAEFTPKLGAVSVTLSNEEIMLNSGDGQLIDLLETHIAAAEQELQDRFVEDIHSDGTADGGKQIGGLQLAIPTTDDSGTYGGISRADNAIWRTTTYDVSDGDIPGVASITKDTIKESFDHIVIDRSRGKKGPDLILADSTHYKLYMQALEDHQRLTDPKSRTGKLGFPSLAYVGAGKQIDIVLEGGIGSAMPSGTTYFIDSSALKFRYHPDRDFSKFGGKQTPVNQDAIVQHIGFFGELTMCNPLHMAKFVA